ncbi:MAG: DNA translocase FtsK [Pirellulales bacterium]|nr:DNA translocase FtsK [Pirellulales bacterium]
MLEERSLKLDLLALGLLALTVFLAAALLSYDPADPPSKLVFPERAETLNICGRSGALVSRLVLTGLGLGAYYLLVSLALLDAVLLARRSIDQPALRAAGWLLSLVGITTLAAMAVPQWSPGPVIGSGGYFGAAGRGMMEMHFASVGAYILTLSFIFGGLLLCTDYVLIRILAWIVGRPTKGLGRGVIYATMAYSRKLAGRDGADRYEEEEEEEEEEDGEQGEDVAIRVIGPVAEDHPEEEADADDPPREEQEKEKKAARTARKPLASMLRITQGKQAERNEVLDDLAATGTGGEMANYELPGADLLLESEALCFEEHEREVRRKAKVLEKTFTNFGFNVRVVEIQTGPVIAQFEVELQAGLRLSRITGLADDLAIALRVPSVRIVAPIPGKNTVGIEVPNTERQLVKLREVMAETDGKTQKLRIPIFLGKDVSGNPMVVDLASLPHLLIAGRTGTGKSVCLNSIIVSILMTRRPDEVRLLLIDPKMVELSPYKRLPHLMHPVVTDMRKAEAILGWAVEKMEERYQLLARAGVRHISVYNQLGEEELMERMQPEDEEDRKRIPTHIPYVVIVADEMADLMMTAAKEVEGHIIRLAQKSRAVGIHLVLATQKPTVDVITGLIKSNLPARIAFQVASRTDSRVVLDEMGADKLLGNGDMLFLWPGTSTLIRGQGIFLSDDEISGVISAVATSEPHYVRELVQLKAKEPEPGGPQLSGRDELYDAAVDVVVRERRGSVSLLQRNLGVGYGRAARLIDYMAEDGIVGPYNGSQAREVLISLEDWEAMNGQPPNEAAPAAKGRPHSNTILPEPQKARLELPTPLKASRVLNTDFEDAEDEEEDEYEYEEEEYDEDEGEDEEEELEEEDEEPEYEDSEYEDAEYEDAEYEDAEDEELEDHLSKQDGAGDDEEHWTAESA